MPLPGDGHTLGDGQMTSNETAQIPDWTVSNIFKFGPGFEIGFDLGQFQLKADPNETSPKLSSLKITRPKLNQSQTELK